MVSSLDSVTLFFRAFHGVLKSFYFIISRILGHVKAISLA